jgi:hypothetical protein
MILLCSCGRFKANRHRNPPFRKCPSQKKTSSFQSGETSAVLILFLHKLNHVEPELDSPSQSSCPSSQPSSIIIDIQVIQDIQDFQDIQDISSSKASKTSKLSKMPPELPAPPPLPATLPSIQLAHQAIKRHIHETPVLTSRSLSQLASTPRIGSKSKKSAPRMRLFFKCETYQRAGAFKTRGAFFSVSRLAEHRGRGECVRILLVCFFFLSNLISYLLLLWDAPIALHVSSSSSSSVSSLSLSLPLSLPPSLSLPLSLPLSPSTS